MNVVALTGRLTRDPEMKTTANGTDLAKFTLAVDRAGDKQDDGTYAAGFFDVTCWGKTAEIVGQYCEKGKQIGVEGRLLLHKWENQDGEKRSKVEITANQVTLLGSKGDSEGGGFMRTEREDQPGSNVGDSDFASNAGDFAAGTDSDIPF